MKSSSIRNKAGFYVLFELLRGENPNLDSIKTLLKPEILKRLKDLEDEELIDILLEIFDKQDDALIKLFTENKESYQRGSLLEKLVTKYNHHRCREWEKNGIHAYFEQVLPQLSEKQINELYKIAPYDLKLLFFARKEVIEKINEENLLNWFIYAMGDSELITPLLQNPQIMDKIRPGFSQILKEIVSINSDIEKSILDLLFSSQMGQQLSQAEIKQFITEMIDAFQGIDRMRQRLKERQKIKLQIFFEHCHSQVDTKTLEEAIQKELPQEILTIFKQELAKKKSGAASTS